MSHTDVIQTISIAFLTITCLVIIVYLICKEEEEDEA